MQTSSRRSPCPVCGRTKDADCRWNDTTILCHQGSSQGPPAGLKTGEVITVEGRSWALIKRDGGFDGAAAVFKPHKPKRRRGRPSTKQRPKAPKPAIDPVLLATQKAMAGVMENVERALAVPEFVHSKPDELRRDFELIDLAFLQVTEFKETVRKLASQYAQVREHLGALDTALKQLHWQRKDALNFRQIHLGELLSEHDRKFSHG